MPNLVQEILSIWAVGLHYSSHLVDPAVEPAHSNEPGELPAGGEGGVCTGEGFWSSVLEYHPTDGAGKITCQ